MHCSFCQGKSSGGCQFCRDINQQPSPEPGRLTINKPLQGWECPKCKAVMAPFVSACVNCKGKN